MSPNKEKAIFERWPQWFRSAADIRRSGMSDGFRCGDGWYGILYQLCESLEPLVANLEDAGRCFEIVQVKAKFGGLRFYVENGSEEIQSVIASAAELSRRTCLNCGSLGVAISYPVLHNSMALLCVFCGGSRW
jgi:hypothetical protein